MNLENYKKEKLTIDLAKANLEGLKYLAFFAVIFGLPYFLIWGFNSEPFFETENYILKLIFPFLFFCLESCCTNWYTEFSLQNMLKTASDQSSLV